MTIENYQQAAAAELSIAVGHLDAALHFWSPSKGLTPLEERNSGECQRWQKFRKLVEGIKEFKDGEGPGA